MRYLYLLSSLTMLAIAPLAPADAASTDAPAAAAPAAAGSAPAPAQGQPAMQTPAPATEKGKVARAVFTSGIKDREPVDTITTLTNDKDKIYFYTDIRDMSGHLVKHRWEYNGKTMASVEFGIGGPRWRVWSTKRLLPQWTGKWTVSVVDANGTVLDQASFNYIQAKQ